MKTQGKIEETLRQHKPLLTEKFKVAEIGIFGSYIRGEESKGSDVDILVEFKKPVGFLEFMDLEDYLENLIGRKVDIVSKKALKPRIGEQILKEVVYV